MSDISQISVKSVTYDVKDSAARESIGSLSGTGVTGGSVAAQLISLKGGIDSINNNKVAKYDALLNTTPYASHNGIYRGKVLVDTTGGSAPYTMAQLHTMVSKGDFSDIYVGDIIRVKCNNVVTDFIVMAINWYIHMGVTEQTANHLVLVPREALGAANMNSTNTTGVSENPDNPSDKAAYAGCDMRNITLPTYLGYIEAAIGASYLLNQSWLLSQDMDAKAVSAGCSVWVGTATGWDWYTSKIELLNTIEVFGFNYGNIFDAGINHRQLPGFKLNPDLIVKGANANDRDSWWLSTVFSSTTFTAVNGDGNATNYYASFAIGVVPKVLFG